jgi:hypothetical protein
MNNNSNNKKNVKNLNNLNNKNNSNNKKNVKNKNITLGIKVDNSSSHIEQLESLKKNLRKNNEKVKTFKSQVTNLKKFNNKLSDGYQLSLRMVVDVSDLLHRHVKVFETLEVMMKDIEETFEFNEEDFQYIRNLTEKSITDLQSKMHNQIDSMVVIFEKEGMKKEAVEIKKFKELSFEITNNAKKISMAKPARKNNASKNNASKNNSSKNNASKNNAKNPTARNNSANKSTSILSRVIYD